MLFHEGNGKPAQTVECKQKLEAFEQSEAEDPAGAFTP